MGAYGAAKARLFENQTEEDSAVLNADDSATTPYAPSRPQVYWFSRKQRVAQGAYLRGGEIIFRRNGREEAVLKRDDIALPGAHNLDNVLAAVAAACIVGAGAGANAKSGQRFPGVEPPLEILARITRVRYHNDSK